MWNRKVWEAMHCWQLACASLMFLNTPSAIAWKLREILCQLSLCCCYYSHKSLLALHNPSSLLPPNVNNIWIANYISVCIPNCSTYFCCVWVICSFHVSQNVSFNQWLFKSCLLSHHICEFSHLASVTDI